MPVDSERCRRIKAMEPRHSFDWKGFVFALKVITLCLAVGASAYGVAALVTQKPTGPAKLVVAHAPVVFAETDTAPAEVSRSLHEPTIEEMVPQTGKFIAADLSHMMLYLYKDGVEVTEYHIKSKGRPGTPGRRRAVFIDPNKRKESFFYNRQSLHALQHAILWQLFYPWLDVLS
jgi:hypothetical protein